MPRADDRDLSVGPGCSVPATEVTWRFGPSGGPGGQHANRVNSRVEAELDLESARGIDDEVRALLVDRLGPTLRVVVDAGRSQARNRDRALDLLEQRMQEALRVRRPRRPTRPGRGAVERRLSAKRRKAQRKSERGRRWDDD
jgi:ribosome-associated protein